MNETIDYYNRNAEEFIEGTLLADMSDCRERFLKYLPEGAAILDAGCGSGRDTEVFLKKGYLVNAFDASEEICRRVSERLGITVECQRFEDLAGSELYDGIWACASLLHVEKQDLPDVLDRLRELLKTGGVLYASFKEGNGERIKGGRYFHDLCLEDCRRLLEEQRFSICELFESTDVRKDRADEKWVNVIARK